MSVSRATHAPTGTPHKYTVKAGDTPMGITQQLVGDHRLVNDLVHENPSKPALAVGGYMTFQELAEGEELAVPRKWIAPNYRKPGSNNFPLNVGGNATPSVTRGAAGVGGVGGLGQTCCEECEKAGGSCMGAHARAGLGQVSPPPSALQTWGVPIAIGLASIAAGVGLAYVIAHKDL